MRKFLQRMVGKSNFPTFADALPASPTDLALAFVADYKTWNDFADAYHGKSGRVDSAEKSYDALVSKFCGADKVHQLITFSGESSFDPVTDSIVQSEIGDDTAIVRVKHGNLGWNECFYEFEFHMRSDRWVLDEVYYLDHFDDNARLKML